MSWLRIPMLLGTRRLQIGFFFLITVCQATPEASVVSNWTIQPHGRMDYPAIRESSGLVASRRFDDVFWTHNDAHNPASLFAVREHGKLIREYSVPASSNIDWEDIAWDEEGNLYIFDNASLKDSQKRNFVYVFPEPDPFRDQEIKQVRRVVVKYPDGAYDCEAIFVWDGSLFLVTKPWDGSLPRIYRYSDLGNDGTATYVGTVPVYTMVTGADISDDGRRVALCSYVAVMIFDSGDSPAEKLQSEPLMSKLNAGQVEAITWAGRELHISNEQRELFEISKERWQDRNAPFFKTPKVKVPRIDGSPQVDWSLEGWPKGAWLKLHLGEAQAEAKARVVWSPNGLHIGLDVPGGLHLPPFHSGAPEDYEEWFRPGSIYLLVNPDGTRPISYRENDRCIVLGVDKRGNISAQSRYLRPATFVVSEEEPGWITVEHSGRSVLVTLSHETPGMGTLLDERQIGFNIIEISENSEVKSWAPLTLRYSWDAPSIWGILELED